MPRRTGRVAFAAGAPAVARWRGAVLAIADSLPETRMGPKRKRPLQPGLQGVAMPQVRF